MKTRSSAHLVTITNVNPLQTSSDRDDASKLLSEPWLHQHQRKSRTSSRLLGMHQCHIPANQRSLQGRKNWNRFLSRTLGWEKHFRGHRYHRSVWHNAVCMDRNVVVFRSISLHHYISWCHRYRPTPLDTVPAIALGQCNVELARPEVPMFTAENRLPKKRKERWFQDVMDYILEIT